MLTSLLMNSLWSTSDSSKLGMKTKGALKRGVGQEEWYQLRLVNRRSPPVEISDLCFMIARYNLFVDLCRIMKNNYLDTRSPLALRSRKKEIINHCKWLHFHLIRVIKYKAYYYFYRLNLFKIIFWLDGWPMTSSPHVVAARLASLDWTGSTKTHNLDLHWCRVWPVHFLCQ